MKVVRKWSVYSRRISTDSNRMFPIDTVSLELRQDDLATEEEAIAWAHREDKWGTFVIISKIQFDNHE